jgi:MFS family permease
MNLDEIKQINRKLVTLIQITIAGDYISLFTFALLFAQSTNNFLSSGLVIPIKSFSGLLANLLFPITLNRLGLKKMICLTQAIPFFSSIIAFILIYKGFNNFSLLIMTFFIESFFAIWFQTARNSFPKLIYDFCNESHTDSEIGSKLQSQIEYGSVYGMFIGSLLFFIFAYFANIPMIYMLLGNSLSFFIAFLIGTKIPDFKLNGVKFKLLGSLKKIKESKIIQKIFINRTFGLWVPLSLFNTSMFAVTVYNYQLNPSHNSLIGVLIAAGSMYIHSKLGSENNNVFKKIDKSTLGIYGCILFIISVYLLGISTNTYIAIILLVFNGMANAFQVNSTRTILWNNTNSTENSEILNLDLFIGKIVDIITSSLYIFTAQKFMLPVNTGFKFASLWTLVVVLPIFIILKKDLATEAKGKNTAQNNA